MKTLTAFFAIFCLLFSSCTHNYNISIDSYKDKEIIPHGFSKESSFAVIPSENSMLAKEIAGKIETLLKERGYVVTNKENCQYQLNFDFGIESKTETVTVAKTIPGPTKTKRGQMRDKEGKKSTSFEEETETSATVVYVPEERTFFNKKINVHVYDKNNKEVWSAEAFNSGYNGNLRSMVNYLLVPLFNNFGSNKNTWIEVPENDLAVQKLKSL